MLIRQYAPSDCRELTELFYNTVHQVNAKDYTKEQLDAWASGKVDLHQWNRSLQEHCSVVAVENEVIPKKKWSGGFGRTVSLTSPPPMTSTIPEAAT